MFAVIKTGGKQYIVREGETHRFETLPGESGVAVAFSDILMVADDAGETVKVGTPIVAGATISGTIVEHGKGKKITIIKYKPKVRYRRKAGHRQQFTSVKIGKITA